ncbi:protein kinase domain-containing protein [Liberiplasma polymorphum]|uniref:protein kinase domain-containing protein n=1 Tax=Liberiplasma polymorphum TaxID=3374570 RepID=UPI0037756C30
MDDLKVPNKIQEQNDYTIYLDKIIGRGGQGAVFRTKEQNLAVKFLLKNNNIVENEKQYLDYQDKIERVMALRLDEDINICKPLSLLKPPMCGYVMKLLSDLVPTSHLIYANEDDFSEFYMKTQGLKKRVEVLLELSRTLSRLHSKGIVYGDLSPNNVFYSTTDMYSKVWLIDADNMRLMLDSKSSIFTPGFAAPEIEHRITTNTIFSDSFSFALMAFKILFSLSPLTDSIDESISSIGWDASILSKNDNIKVNEKKWLGDVFEIDSEPMIFIRSLITQDLYNLFQQIFTEPGLKLPETRPTMRKWYDEFLKLYEKITQCDCGQTIAVTSSKCPFCNTNHDTAGFMSVFNYKPIDIDFLNSYLEDSDSPDTFYPNGVISENHKTQIVQDLKFQLVRNLPVYPGYKLYNFHIDDLTITKTPELLFSIQVTERALILKLDSNSKLEYLTSKSKFNNNEISLEFNKDHVFKYVCPDTKSTKLIRLKYDVK